MSYEKNTSAELWQTTHNWLTFSGHAVNKKYCREEISTHPDYPSLTAVTDFLDAGGMAYNAVQADASYIKEFNYPLLAHIKHPGQEYMHIISHSGEWDNEKEITKNWTGIVLYPDGGGQWQHKEHDAYRLRQQRNKVWQIGAVLFASGIFALLAYSNPNPFYAIMGILSLAGIILSTWITGTELGVQNSLVKQVCGAVGKGGCEKVLKTNYAKGFAGLTTGDFALIYFATQFAAFVSTAIYPAMFNAMLLVSFTGILVAGWSIYAQAVTLKQWCALCLGIVAILFFQFMLAVFVAANAAIFYMFNWQAMLSFAALVLLAGLIVQPIKQLLTDDHTNTQKLAELKKWKLDAGLFLTQWQQEQEVDTTRWENDLIIGNPQAPLKITVACNPYCGPCAKAHQQLDDMLEKHKNKLCVQLRLLCNAQDALDKRTITLKAILQKAKELKNSTQLGQMLSDWFKEMDYDKWIVRWKAVDDIDVHLILQQHENWVNKSSIAFTPTFFVNGKKLPGRYGLTELEILLPQLVNVFAEQQLVNNL